MAEDTTVPRKYWWVVAIAVPLVIAAIAAVPGLVNAPDGTGSTSITGDNNTVTFDYSTRNTFVTNVNVIAREYELQTGRPLSDDLRQQIEASVAAAMEGNHTESIRLLEKVAEDVPVPAVYNNLGVEYARTQNADASRRSFELSKAKMAEVAAAVVRNGPLPAAALRPPSVSGPSLRTESSTVPALVIEPLTAPYVPAGEIHVIVHGTPLSGSYPVKYRPEAGTTVAAEPGAYDVLLKAGSYGAGFVLASNVIVREGTLTRINPNGLVGGIAVEAVAKKGFPPLQQVQFIDRATGEKRLLAQQTDKMGVTLPLAPGSYDAVGTTVDGQTMLLAEGIAVRAGQITRFDALGQMASVLVYTPKVKGLDMKAVYALKTGTNQIAGKVEAWDVPMLVAAGTYDVALEQSAGLTHIRKAVTLRSGELLEIR